MKGFIQEPKMKSSDMITQILASLAFEFWNFQRKLGEDRGP
jgi:hypothetical protein